MILHEQSERFLDIGSYICGLNSGYFLHTDKKIIAEKQLHFDY